MITSKAMARKIFVPILATLMVAGLSAGFASPAKADNVSNTIIIHYQDPDATSFDSYKDWNLWIWANGSTADNSKFDGHGNYFNGSDSYGKSFTMTLSDTASLTSLGVIVRTDGWSKIECANCDWGANRTIPLDASGTTEVWIQKGAADQYTTSAPAGAATSPWNAGDVDPNFDCDSNNVCLPHVVMPSSQHLVLHYQDPAATKFSSYKGWDVFVYAGGGDSGGGGHWFNGSDSFGKVLDLNFTGMSRVKNIGVIVRKNNWSDRAGWKDGTGDAGADGKGGNRSIALSTDTGENEIWIVRGADKNEYYTSLADAQAAGAVAAPWADGAVDPGYGSDGLPVAGYPASQTFRIHYNRPDGNYGDWNIWSWGTNSAADGGHDFTGTDAFGVYTDIAIPGNASLVAGIGYLLRSTHDWGTAVKNAPEGNQDSVDNPTIADGKTSGLTEIWVKAGDKSSYLANPYPVPHVGALTPASVGYGQAVAIAGTGLTGASSVTLVRDAVAAVTATKVGSAWKCGTTTRSQGYVCTAAVPAATATAVARVVSATKIVAAFPNSGALVGKIVVKNPAGTATSAGSLTLKTTASAASISASTAKGVIGDTVTVTGTNIGAATSVKLGTLDITDFTVNDVNSLSFVVPAGATDGKISVTTAAGTKVAAKAFALVPSISSVTSSVAIGGTVTVSGANLANASAVKLGTKAITSFIKGASEISFTVPAGSATGKVTVTTPGGSVISADSVTVLLAPTVTSVTGAKTGTKFNKGATLTITGKNLTGATSVYVGASAVTDFTVVNSTTITFTAPTNKTGKVSVTTPGGTGSSSASITTTS